MWKTGGGAAPGDVGEARQRMAPWLTAATRVWSVVAVDERSTVTLRRSSNDDQRSSRNDSGDATSATKATNPAKSRFFVMSTFTFSYQL